MQLIQARKHIALPHSISRAMPTLQHLNEQLEADDYLPGVWQDGPYYLIGMSHFDTAPEEIILALTDKQWKNRADPQRLGVKEMGEALALARRLYPTFPMK